jgi:hypothetical protein
MINFNESYINDEMLPLVWEITSGKEKDIKYISEWLKEKSSDINKVLNKQGALLIRGFDRMKSAEDFQTAITSIFPSLMDYVGGTSPRDQVHGNIMTATKIPASWSIPLHQEMSYLKHHPSRIAFFCTYAAAEGGHSTLGDMRAMTKMIDKNMLKKFKAHGLQLCRSLPSLKTLHDKPGVQKPWSEVFSTLDKNEVDEVSRKKGWKTEWLDGDTLQIWQDILPATKFHPHDQTEVWFNQVHMFSPSGSEAWAKRDGREEDYKNLRAARSKNPEMLDKMLYGNGELVSDEDAVYISKLLEKSVKLNNTDLLILDNTFVAHGRLPFSGKRDILVALIDSRS